MRPLSLAPLTINDAGPLDLIAAAAAGGFEAVTLRVIAPPGLAPAPPLDVAAVRRRLADTGLRIVAATGMWLTSDFVARKVEAALATAAELGAAWCLAAGYDPDPARLTDSFVDLCETAEGLGLGIALEFMPYLQPRNLAEAVDLLDRAGRRNAGLVIDALHLARSGGTPAEVAALPGGRIAYCQLCDAPRDRPAGLAPREESLRHRLYPGEGELPLRDLLAALPANIMLDLEAPCAADAHLSFEERGRRAGEALRRFLAGR